MEKCGYVVFKDPSMEDKMRLLQTFPEEIWAMIFSSLRESEDFINVSNASPALGELLPRRKMEYLFPGVWHILNKRLTQADAEGSVDEGDLDDYNEEFQWIKDMLTLRLTSSEWKDVFDHCHFTKALSSAYGSNGTQFRVAISPENPLPLENLFDLNSDRLTQFLTHFEDTHGNGRSKFSPFLSNAVRFYIPVVDDEMYPNFERKMSELFREYGNHIRICTFQMKISDLQAETFSTLQRWISLLPNLVSLTVTGSRCEEEALEVLEFTEQLPELKKLKYLILWNVFPSEANLFLRSYNHVAFLHVDPMKEGPTYDVTSVPFPNLTSLTITVYNMIEFQKLETTQFGGDFQNLAVTFGMPDPPLPQVFALLERKWGTCLKRLNITIRELQWETLEKRNRVENEIMLLKQQHFPGMKENDSLVT